MTVSSLSSPYFSLLIQAKKGTPILKINFNFDLIFDLERYDD